MVKPVKTWIVVADAARARLVMNDGVGHGISDVPGGEFDNDLKHDGDVYADRPGRVHDRAAAGRHAMERPNDTKQLSAAAFAKEIAGHLERLERKGGFDRLVVIAEPTFLGHLRHALPKQIARRVSAEIAKDLTKASPDDLMKHLQPVLAV